MKSLRSTRKSEMATGGVGPGKAAGGRGGHLRPRRVPSPGMAHYAIASLLAIFPRADPLERSR